jgi:hypothetical protein
MAHDQQADGKVEERARRCDQAPLATAASLVTMLAIPGVGAVVGAGGRGSVGQHGDGGRRGLLGLTNAGINEEDAQVFVEGVRRGEPWSQHGCRRANCRGSCRS